MKLENEISVKLRKSYELRSKHVHTGRLASVHEEREACVELVRRVVAEELRDFARVSR